MIAIGIVAIPVYARLVRAVVLQLKQMEFITATRSLGRHSVAADPSAPDPEPA